MNANHWNISSEYPRTATVLGKIKYKKLKKVNDKPESILQLEVPLVVEKGKFGEKQLADNVEKKVLVTIRVYILAKLTNDKLDMDEKSCCSPLRRALTVAVKRKLTNALGKDDNKFSSIPHRKKLVAVGIGKLGENQLSDNAGKKDLVTVKVYILGKIKNGKWDMDDKESGYISLSVAQVAL